MVDGTLPPASTLRKFVREVAIKENCVGGMWHVRPEFVEKYGLLSSPPDDFYRAKAQEDAEKKKLLRKGLYCLSSFRQTSISHGR